MTLETDGVAMGLPLGVVFMVLRSNLKIDSYEWIPVCTSEFIISVLNTFDKNIQYTFEENDEKIPFLDIWIISNRNDNTTTVCRRSACNNIYLNWNLSASAT